MTLADIEKYIKSFPAKETVPLYLRISGVLYEVTDDMLKHIGHTTQTRGYHAAIVLDITKIIEEGKEES